MKNKCCCRKKVLALVIVSIFLSESILLACSTLCVRFDGRIVFGKNYDWSIEDGVMIVNQRGVKHTADRPADRHSIPASWTSQFGSVTFNQYGRNFPMGGMNEAGLVVELLWADGSRYPGPDVRPVVDCLEWIQYQLDTAETVAQVIASDSKVRIQSQVPLHYLIADRKGSVAAIEFVRGKMVAYTGRDLPVAALTNDLYADSLEFLKKNSHWMRTDAGSPARFQRAAHHVENFKSGDPVEYVFQSLDDVHSEITRWSIVYEIDQGLIHFRTKSNPQIRDLAMKDLDFSCASPVLMLNLNEKVQGDIRAQLHEYSNEENLKMIRTTFSQTDFLAKTPLTELQRIASLPEQSSCVQ
jgi:penicillin V acylase-like amidase (Ntn superfamily)